MLAVAMLVALQKMRLNVTILSAFAPDFAMVLFVLAALLRLPAVLRAGTWIRRSFARNRLRPP